MPAAGAVLGAAAAALAVENPKGLAGGAAGAALPNCERQVGGRSGGKVRKAGQCTLWHHATPRWYFSIKSITLILNHASHGLTEKGDAIWPQRSNWCTDAEANSCLDYYVMYLL